MQFTFLSASNVVLFTRDDAERADWTQEEMTLNADFPYLADKNITTGQRILFRDPSTGEQQIYEVKQPKTLPNDFLQQITAENICISELSDEHINNTEITNTTIAQALETVLSGTLWSVGNVSVNPVSSVDISRGSVWQAVCQIKNNYNVYIEPRTTLSGGTLSRYLDVKSTEGTWNGIRLSVDKNILDPAITIDDSEVVTAMYGYGGTEPSTDPDVEPQETTFAGIAWAAEDGHPAKPYGQTYLEDPTATQLYGRDGRPRYGFYQNTDITDPSILLQKTWEALQAQSSPAISIDGTVEDLYRMGYADQPLKLHDIALVEILPVGFKKQIQIIRITTDLLDPSNTTLTIGAYIPNIIYIERKTSENVTGSAGGGGGNSNKGATTWQEFRTTINAYADQTGLEIKAVQNDIKHQEEEIAIQSGRISVAYNRIDAEVVDRRNADQELNGRITVQANKITAEVTRAQGAETALSGRITITERAITQEVTDRTNADRTLSGRIDVNADKVAIVVTDDGGGHYSPNSASIVAGINSQTGSYVLIDADTINLSGYVTADELSATNASIDNLKNGTTQATSIRSVSMSTNIFLMAGTNVTWQTATISGTTIHYLGY